VMWPNFERSPSHGTSKLLPREYCPLGEIGPSILRDMKIICGAGRIRSSLGVST